MTAHGVPRARRMRPLFLWLCLASIGAKDPFAPPARGEERVAHCIAGGLRTFADPDVHEAIRDHLVDGVGGATVELLLYLDFGAELSAKGSWHPAPESAADAAIHYLRHGYAKGAAAPSPPPRARARRRTFGRDGARIVDGRTATTARGSSDGRRRRDTADRRRAVDETARGRRDGARIVDGPSRADEAARGSSEADGPRRRDDADGRRAIVRRSTRRRPCTTSTRPTAASSAASRVRPPRGGAAFPRRFAW